jgi:voltage-gated potassium channel
MLPRTVRGPLRAVLRRVLIALAILLVSALIVYFGRHGYRDSSGKPVGLLTSFYYATVTLSTTGYGDVVPVSDWARLINTMIITPLRILFLLVLVGTTLEVLTERTRYAWHQERWRSKVRQAWSAWSATAAAKQTDRLVVVRSMAPKSAATQQVR